jgi:V/A-type H+-transporting ATPase subunit D
MRRLRVPPTKSSLLRLKRQVGFLMRAREMLERKRDLLRKLVHERAQRYRKLVLEARSALHEAYGWLVIARLRMGSHALRQAAVGLQPCVSVHVIPGSSAGVQHPTLRVEEIPLRPIGLMRTDASFDEARKRLAGLVVLLARLGEAETTLRRLLCARRKIQRRVNALRHNIIPMHLETIAFIQSALEEEERSTLFRLRVLQERQLR